VNYIEKTLERSLALWRAIGGEEERETAPEEAAESTRRAANAARKETRALRAAEAHAEAAARRGGTAPAGAQTGEEIGPIPGAEGTTDAEPAGFRADAEEARAAEAARGEVWLAALSRALERDARRYDGGFGLY